VLSGLKEKLLAPEAFEQFALEYFALEYKETLRRAVTDRGDQLANLRRQHANTIARIDRIVEAIAEGSASSSLKAKLSVLEADKERLGAELKASEARHEPVELHPNLPELYRRRVADLEGALTRAPAERAAAREILRSFIERVVVYPGDRRGETIIKLEGSIAAILDFAQLRSRERTPYSGDRTPNRSVVKMVPQGRN
jgi:site-specific DNA recombinase